MDVLGADEISLRSRSSTRTCNASYPSPFYAETVEPTAQLGRGISTVVITASASNGTSVSNMSCAALRRDSISRSRVRSCALQPGRSTAVLVGLTHEPAGWVVVVLPEAETVDAANTSMDDLEPKRLGGAVQTAPHKDRVSRVGLHLRGQVYNFEF